MNDQPERRMSDERALTGWCRTGSHALCCGAMLGGTGWNWYCICDCHGERVVNPSGNNRKAVEFWREKRAAASVPAESP